jgi:hypothetical protein
MINTHSPLSRNARSGLAGLVIAAALAAPTWPAHAHLDPRHDLPGATIKSAATTPAQVPLSDPMGCPSLHIGRDRPAIAGLRAQVDGQLVATALITMQIQAPIGSTALEWATFDVTFPAGPKRRIDLSYTLPPGTATGMPGLWTMQPGLRVLTAAAQTGGHAQDGPNVLWRQALPQHDPAAAAKNGAELLPLIDAALAASSRQG